MDTFPPATQPPAFNRWVLATVLLPFVGFLGFIAAAGVEGVSSAARRSSETAAKELTPAMVAGFSWLAVCLIATFVVYGMTIYKLWSVVQDGRARLSPGSAAALSVIPVVNLVGMFFAFVGLAPELNRKLADVWVARSRSPKEWRSPRRSRMSSRRRSAAYPSSSA